MQSLEALDLVVGDRCNSVDVVRDVALHRGGNQAGPCVSSLGRLVPNVMDLSARVISMESLEADRVTLQVVLDHLAWVRGLILLNRRLVFCLAACGGEFTIRWLLSICRGHRC